MFLTHFELIFVLGILHAAVQCSPYYLLKRLSFLQCVLLAPLSWLSVHRCYGFISEFISAPRVEQRTQGQTVFTVAICSFLCALCKLAGGHRDQGVKDGWDLRLSETISVGDVANKPRRAMLGIPVSPKQAPEIVLV